jgi:hypothetical protein
MCEREPEIFISLQEAIDAVVAAAAGNYLGSNMAGGGAGPLTRALRALAAKPLAPKVLWVVTADEIRENHPQLSEEQVAAVLAADWGRLRHSSMSDSFLDQMHQIVTEVAGEPMNEPPEFGDYPDTCQSSHWNAGDDFCVDCGLDLNSTEPEVLTRAELIEAMGEERYYRWMPGEDYGSLSAETRAERETIPLDRLKRMTDVERRRALRGPS